MYTKERFAGLHRTDLSPLLNVSVQLTFSEGVTSVLLLFLSLTVRDVALEIDTAATDDNVQPTASPPGPTVKAENEKAEKGSIR